MWADVSMGGVLRRGSKTEEYRIEPKHISSSLHQIIRCLYPTTQEGKQTRKQATVIVRKTIKF